MMITLSQKGGFARCIVVLYFALYSLTHVYARHPVDKGPRLQLRQPTKPRSLQLAFFRSNHFMQETLHKAGRSGPIISVIPSGIHVGISIVQFCVALPASGVAYCFDEEVGWSCLKMAGQAFSGGVFAFINITSLGGLGCALRRESFLLICLRVLNFLSFRTVSLAEECSNS